MPSRSTALLSGLPDLPEDKLQEIDRLRTEYRIRVDRAANEVANQALPFGHAYSSDALYEIATTLYETHCQLFVAIAAYLIDFTDALQIEKANTLSYDLATRLLLDAWDWFVEVTAGECEDLSRFDAPTRNDFLATLRSRFEPHRQVLVLRLLEGKSAALNRRNSAARLPGTESSEQTGVNLGGTDANQPDAEHGSSTAEARIHASAESAGESSRLRPAPSAATASPGSERKPPKQFIDEYRASRRTSDGKNLSYEKLAGEIGISREVLFAIAGEKRRVNPEMYIATATKIDCSPEDLHPRQSVLKRRSRTKSNSAEL